MTICDCGATAAMVIEFPVMIDDTNVPWPTTSWPKGSASVSTVSVAANANDVLNAVLTCPFSSTCAVSTPESRMNTFSPAPCVVICHAESAWTCVMFHCRLNAAAVRGSTVPRGVYPAACCNVVSGRPAQRPNAGSWILMRLTSAMTVWTSVRWRTAVAAADDNPATTTRPDPACEYTIRPPPARICAASDGDGDPVPLSATR